MTEYRVNLAFRAGYLFEFERRGYLQAGPFVPEVVLEHPHLVTAMYEEFVHAGSDVVEAFTVRSEHLLTDLPQLSNVYYCTWKLFEFSIQL